MSIRDLTEGLCVLTIRDGRDDVHTLSLESLQVHCPEPEHHVIVDDSGHELGFAGAIQKGWEQVRETGAEYVLHHEADFLFSAQVPIDRMIGVLKRRPYLAQLVLKRQPQNDAERAVGGIVECWPEEYQQVTDNGDVFSEHRLFWSTNPAIYSAGWCHQDWPQVDGSERVWTERLLGDPDLRFAFWGAKSDPPAVEHIGVRVGHSY